MSDVLQIGPGATSLMIGQEVGSEALYTEKYQHPTWPGADSGVTIAIGYDVGQMGVARLEADWKGLLDDATIARLAAACGVVGAAAEAMLPGLQDITIPFSVAMTCFQERTLPRVIEETVAAFPGAEKLPPNALGALVSLVYNRGPLIDYSDRRREMRQIRTCVQSGHLYLIPDLFRSMDRIWVGTPIYNDMVERRAAEADLFQRAISTIPAAPGAAIPAAAAPEPPPAPAPAPVSPEPTPASPQPQDVAINTDH